MPTPSTADFFEKYLNAGEKLIWTGTTTGFDFSLKSVALVFVYATCIVLSTYGIAWLLGMAKNWPRFLTKFQPILVGSIAGSAIFAFNPSSNVIYGVTNQRALILNRSAKPPSISAVALNQVTVLIDSNKGGSWTVVFQDSSGNGTPKMVFKKVLLPPPVLERLKQLSNS